MAMATVTSMPSGAAYAEGETITIDVEFMDVVHVRGRVHLELSVGRENRDADFVSGSGTTTLTFAYVVAPGDFDSDGISVAGVILGEGTIENADGEAVNQMFASLPANPAHRVDALAPQVAVDAVQVTSLPSGEAYADGETITVQVRFTGVVHVRGQALLELAIGPDLRYADFVSGSGTRALTFAYVVALGDFDSDGISVTGNILGGLNSIVDASGAAADRGFAALAADRNQRVDANIGETPAVLQVAVASSPAQGGAYRVGEFIDLRVVFHRPVFVRRCDGDLPVLQLAISESSPEAEIFAGSGTDTLWFRYQVQPGDFDEDGISVSAGPGALTGGCIEDAGGRAVSRRFRAIPAQAGHRVDGLAPSALTARVVSRPAGTRYGIGEAIEIEATFSEAVYVAESNDLALLLGVGASVRRAAYTEGSGTDTLSFVYVVERGDRDEDGIDIGPDALVGGTIQDVAGNLLELEGRRRLPPVPAQAAHRVDASIDVAAPRVESVAITSTPRGRAYVIRETVVLEMRFSEVVHVAGVPQLALSLGGETRLATLRSGGGTDTLTFAYVVADGDFDGDGIAVGPGAQALAGGRIEDAAGNAADRYFEGLPANAGHLVDARFGVRVEAVSIVPAPHPARRAGDAIDVDVHFSDVVHVSGAPMLTLLVGGGERQARLLRGSGTRTLVFRYVVESGDVDDDGVSIGASALFGGAIADRQGGAVETGFFALPAQPQHRVDAMPAEVAGTVIDSDPGPDRTYRAGDRITIRVSFTEAVLVTGNVALLLSVGPQTRTAPLAEGGGTDTLTFAYEVQAGDRSAGVSVPADAVTGGRITDLAGNEAVRAWPGLPADGRHRANGAVPSVVAVRVTSDPGADRIYAPGDTIIVAVRFDTVVHVDAAPALTLLVGGRSRQAALLDGSGTNTLQFGYVVQEGEYDGDGISVNGLAGGAIADGHGNAADRQFVSRREPDHRVGQELVHVLPEVTVEVGSQTRIDLEAELLESGVRFVGPFERPVTADESVARARVTGRIAVVVAVSEGITVVGASAIGVPITVAIPVRVETSVAERAVIGDGLAAIGRGLLASQTDTLARRLQLARHGGVGGGHGAGASGNRVPWKGDGRGPEERFERVPGAWGAGGTGDGLHGSDGWRRHERRGETGATGIPRGRIFSMELTGSGAGAVSWGVWTGGDSQTFEGGLAAGDYDGSVQSVHLGFDARARDWVAGAAVSRVRADASYEFGNDGAGVMETQLNTVSPYVQWTPNGGTVLWTVLGLGTGEASARRDGQEGSIAPVSISSRLGLLGGRHHVGGALGLELALRADAGMVQLKTDRGLGAIEGLVVNVQRLRAGVEAAWPLRLGSGELVPFVDFGGRWDGGDGATGAGAEVAGGLRYRGAVAGLELRARSLVHHGMAATEERGFAATFFVEPDAQGRGWRLSLSPRRGDAEWTDRFSRSPSALAAGVARRAQPGWQWQARVGYGLSMRGRPGTLTPFAEVDTNGPGGARTRLGAACEMTGGARRIRLEALLERAGGGRSGGDGRRVLVTAEARF